MSLAAARLAAAVGEDGMVFFAAERRLIMLARFSCFEIGSAIWIVA
jgi:hypothetical protein